MKLVILLILVNVALSEYCSQDEDEGCTFECHCAKKDECRGGRCPGGCERAALGCNWGGVACQTGNVGLHKNANMTLAKAEQYRKYPPTGALDGQIVLRGFNNHCAHPGNNGTSPAEWWADLGNIYKIYNITIYGRRDCCEWRLQKFDLTIYNTSDNEVLCAYHKNIISTNATITCNKPVIGRYVHFKRKGGDQIHYSALCEVIIIGHRVYDCSNCPDSATCNDDTGCQTCVGSYQPECKPECRDGSYGINCNQRCSVHCKTNNTCDKVSGQCVDGCQLWWADDRCMTSIDKPVHTNESTQILTVSSSSIQIEWEKLKSMSANLSQFYGYVVVYKESNTKNYTEVLSRNHNSSRDVFVVDITNLMFNTHYDIEVWPYREMNGQREFGSRYMSLQVKTSCIAPEKPSIWNITTSVIDDNQIPNITVYYQSVTDLIPNCHEITNISLNYQLAQGDQFHTVALSLNDNMYTIIPDSKGQYHIWITVTNNEQYSSDSEKYLINIKGSVSVSSQHTAIFVSIPLAIIVAVIVSVVAGRIWIRRRASGEKRQYVNQALSDDEPKVDSENTEKRVNAPQGRSGDRSYRRRPSSIVSLDYVSESVEEMENDVAEEEESLYANNAIHIGNFEGYVARRMAEIQTLENEYETLPDKDFSRCLVAVTDENKDKNRFLKIYPYDDNRVLLESSDSNDSDYINASYITGFNKQKEYIATQGPKPNTLTDFWRMIWQAKSNRIVMVANVVELGKRKVEPYWCETLGETLSIGEFSIKTESLLSSADYDHKTISLMKENQRRTIHHFHFKTWEDKGKPKYGSHTLLAFMDRVHSLDKHSQGPLVVHCSAGVGRTGTFIALDILQQMAVKQNAINIQSCVQRLRRERMLSVQVKEQYIFLHEAMVEFIKHMNTSHDCNRFTQKFASVCEQHPDPEIMSVLQKELKHLLHPKKVTCDQSNSDFSDANKDKNRNLEIVPADSERLFISTRNGNYINAVSVDSFAAHDSKIVTQMPLPHTMGDFWKLVMEQSCHAIVMLNELNESDSTCAPYWPETINSKKSYEQVEVELLSSDDASDFVVTRDFKVTEMKQKRYALSEVLTIRQFQLKSWPKGQTLIPHRKHLFDLLDQLYQWQQHKKIPSDKWKILVHCIDGGSRSGLFCGASFLLDRLKAEQDVNVYLAARSIRRRRSHFITNIVEYQFLYQMAIEYLTESNEYVNVR